MLQPLSWKQTRWLSMLITGLNLIFYFHISLEVWLLSFAWCWECRTGWAAPSCWVDWNCRDVRCFSHPHCGFLCLTDRSWPTGHHQCLCICGKPSSWSLQDDCHLWLWSSRKLSQHWHWGQMCTCMFCPASKFSNSLCSLSVSLIMKGWTDLQRWRHHSCVRWHGWGWLLLRKCLVIRNMKIAVTLVLLWQCPKVPSSGKFVFWPC